MNVVDRRLNPKGKSLENRQRFIDRARDQVRKAVAEAIARRGVADVAKPGEKVTVRTRNTAEPSFVFGPTGNREYVLPGNKTYQTGDAIPRPQGTGGGTGGDQASADGGGTDDFVFTLTREEFLQVFFEDLELPDLVRKTIADLSTTRPQRAGHATTGTPSSLNVVRTMRNSLARRIGLARPDADRLAELRAALETAVASGDDAAIAAAREELEASARRAAAIPFIDPVDVRYNRFERVPKPNNRAVMFCLMDVSGSMSETRKDLAKRFFMLLHLFLETRYDTVDIVFVRHTESAQEVDEETFFRSTESGGTIVSSALEEMLRIQQARYPESDWNVYVAQASDGDNLSHDSTRCLSLLEQRILPGVQYFAYIETRETGLSVSQSDLWRHYATLERPGFVMRRVGAAAEIYPVFRDLFARRPARTA